MRKARRIRVYFMNEKLLLNTGLGLAETGYFSERPYSRVRISCRKIPIELLG